VPARPAPALDERSLRALLDSYAGADHFKVLGVAQDATAAQVKAAYFQLARVYHPDTVQPDLSPEVKQLCADLFSRISEAWGVLGDDARRAQYLEELRTGNAEKVDVSAYFKAEEVFLKGTLLVKSRQYEEALAQFKEAVRLDAETPEYPMWIAWCQFLMAADKKAVHGRLAGAIEAGLKKASGCVPGYLFLGQMAKVIGDLATAEKQLRRGLAVAPDHPDLQRELKFLRK
jgi:curved DNA-binding protein CbpA